MSHAINARMEARLMAVTRINKFTARAGAEEALHNALLEIVPVIANADACRKVRMLSSLDRPGDFIVYEEWDSVEAHKKAARQIPAAHIAKITALLEGAPEGDYYAGVIRRRGSAAAARRQRRR